MLTETTTLRYLFNFTQHFQSWLTFLPATCAVFMLRSLGLLHKLVYRRPFLWEHTFSETVYHICIILTDYGSRSQLVNWWYSSPKLSFFLQQDRPNWTKGFWSRILHSIFQDHTLIPKKLNYWEKPTLTNLLPNHLSPATHEKAKTNTKYNEAGWAQNPK